MPLKPTIKAQEVLADIREGLADSDLMEKYGLSPEEFHSLLAYLVDTDLVSRDELVDRGQLSESQIIRLFVESREGSKKLD